MPIRFRCAYCNQLMGIATRKAGTVVSCPKCGGQVVVPKPEPDSVPDQESPLGGADNLLEDQELAHLLELSNQEQEDGGQPIPTAAKADPHARQAPSPAARPLKQAMQDRAVRGPEPKHGDPPSPAAQPIAPLAAPATPSGLVIPMPVFYILNGVGVFLLVMTFVAGYWMGKSAGTAAPPPVEKKDDAK